MKKRFLSLLLCCVMLLGTLPTAAFAVSYEDYGIYVGGMLVTPDYLSGEGWSFDPETYTLTLKNFDVGTSAYVQKLESTTLDCNKFIIYIATNKLITLNVVGDNLIGDEGYSSGQSYNFTYRGERVSYRYYGILGKGDNTRLRITGSGKLKIVTNQAAIDVGELDVDMDPGGSIECRSYYIPIRLTKSAVFQGSSKVSAECTSGNSTPQTYAGIYSRGDITIRDNASVEGRIYREERTDKNAIYTKGNLNIEGGDLTGRVLLYADSDSERTVGNAIRAKNLYISGGGMVTGLIENLDGYDLICNGYGIDGEVCFRGPGTLRYGSSKKTSFTGIQAAKVTAAGDNDLIYSTPDSERPWTYWEYDQYGEIRCQQRTQVYLWEKDGTTSWSYVRDESYATAYSGELPLDQFFPEDSQLSLVVISGDHVITPDNRPNHVPPIVVEGGSLTLNMKPGKEFYKLTNPVEVKAGATLVVSGDGLLYNLQATGEGTIRFESGTVRDDSSVASSLNLVVTGGSINPAGAVTAKNASGETVNKYKFHLGSGNHSIQSIRLKKGTYNATGIVPEQGYFYLWLPSTSTLDRVVALDSGNNAIQLRLLDKTSSDFYQLWKITAVEPNYQQTIVALPEKNVYVHSLYWTFQDQSRDYTINWTVSKDGGLTWEQKATFNDSSDSIVPEGNVGATEEMNGWIYRAEIRNNGEEDIAAVFEAQLYVHAPTLTASQSSYNPGKDILLEVTTLSVEEDVRFEYTWQADFGSGYKTIGTDSPTCTIPATEAMTTTPPKVKCQVRVWYTDDVGRVNHEFKDATTQELTITVEEKRPVITVQPQASTRLNSDLGEECTLSVTAEKAETYQWQKLVSGEYQDIPGAARSSYLVRANRETQASVYRCAVSNSYGTVYSQQARIEPVFDPYFSEDPQNALVTEGDSASFSGGIAPGYDGTGTSGSSFWQVSKDGGATWTDAKDLAGAEITPTKSAATPACDVGSQLVLRNTTREMSGWYFRLALQYGTGKEIYSQPATLTVQNRCTQHVWDEGRVLTEPTCTLPGLKLQSCTNCLKAQEVPIPAKGHDWQPATCMTPAVCSVCQESYGEKNPNNHTDTTKWIQTATTHTQTYKCCGAIVVAEESHEWENGVCAECGYGCGHQYSWQSNSGQYWQHCAICGFDTNKKAIPAISINGADKVCRTQDYKFSFSLPEGATDVSCGYGFALMGSDVPLTLENGVYSGVMKAEWYDESETSFILTVYAQIDDGFTFTIDKTVTILNEHTGGTATCTEQATCEVCGESYGELDANSHSDLKHFPATASTKTAEGNIEYWYCSDCGKYYKDAEATQEITKDQTVTAKLPSDNGGSTGGSTGNNDRPSSGTTTSPQTGDASNLTLWIALLFVSGGAGTLATVCGRKKNRSVK